MNKKAFTLVELIVVITILAILGTIAFISLQGYSRDARDSTRLSDIKSTETGLELFAIKVGKYPVPDSVVSYTGGSAVINQGILGEGVTRNTKLSKIVLDPVTKANYVYSTFGNGKYYQLAADLENLQASIISQANAESPTSSLVRGNYTFDPILPSLILVPISVTSSGIFDKNVCFVLNGGVNTINNCVETKAQMNLKSIDKNLIAYYDMETIFNSGGTDYMKDLSGNSYDLIFTGTILPTSTGGIIGKGYYFAGTGMVDNTNYSQMQSEKVLKYNNSKELTISIIVKTEETCPLNPNDFIGAAYASAVVESSDNFNSNTGAFVLEESDYSNGEFLKECATSGGFKSNLLGFWKDTYSIVRSNKRVTTLVWKKITMTVNYSDKGYIETQLYINGVKQSNITSIYNNKIIDFINDYILYIGSRSTGAWGYKGTIDDIKIYNRALSDSEIIQQSKVLGF